MAIDLHTHSTFSDGTMSPTALVRFAAQKGLTGFSVTDHDSVEGVAEARIAGEREGVTVIPGVELSVVATFGQMHLLGYMFDSLDTKFLQAIHRLQEGRNERNSRILCKLSELGYCIEPEELARSSGHGQCGRPHIARIMVQEGWVKNMNMAFREYLGQGKPAYCSRFLYTLEQAIDILHEAGGIAVLAHPLQLGIQEEGLEPALKNLKDSGLDGVEVYYPTHSKKFRKKLCLLCEQLGLLKTGGSDYHGSIRPGTTLAGRRNMSVPDDYLSAILQYTAQQPGID